MTFHNKKLNQTSNTHLIAVKLLLNYIKPLCNWYIYLPTIATSKCILPVIMMGVHVFYLLHDRDMTFDNKNIS